jgi:ATP-binding cassette subfamily B multidrug efflux pump
LKELKTLNKYLSKYRWRLILGLLFVTASNLFAVFPAQLVRKSIDLVKEKITLMDTLAQAENIRTAMTDEIFDLILYFSFLILTFALIKGIFMYLMRQTLIVMSRLVEYDLKNDIFSHYQKLNLSFYRSHSTGDMMARIAEDVSRVRMYIGPAIMYMMNLSVTIIVVLWAMFSVNIKLTLWVLLPLPFLSYTIFYVNNIINKRSDAIQSQLSTLSSIAQEVFSGIRIVKSFAVEKEIQANYANASEDYRQKSMSLAKVDAIFFPSMLLLTGLSTLITVWIGGMMVVRQEITLGNIAEFVIYVNMLTWPVTSLGWTTSLIQRAAASQKRINEFLDEPLDQSKDTGHQFTFNHKIRFDNVTFTYPNKKEAAISKISFELEKGKTLAILGQTGSGKSTLVQLFLRIISPESGNIYIDDASLETINLKSFMDKVGYAPQDVFLFSDTIAENIKFGIVGDNESIESHMKKAADIAALNDSISQFPLKYETVIGERGITLSGGQKQRVALARAIIKNPEVLVLDDTLSAVDAQTEKQIMGNLNTFNKDRTTIIITHRASAAMECDMILVMDKGNIVEIGTPEELANRKSYVKKLLESQNNQ